MTTEIRIAKALEFAVEYGSIDGAHHKDWVIDQMVRALTGCPMVTVNALDWKGIPFQFEKQGESDEYRKLVADAKDGADGPDSYEWDTGIAP